MNARHGIDRVVLRITPEYIRAAINRDSSRELQARIRMDIYDVFEDEAGWHR